MAYEGVDPDTMRNSSARNPSADLALAHRLADLASGIARSHLAAGPPAVRTKSDGSPVTEADRHIELALRDLLGRERPDDDFLGEEFGAYGGGGRRGWIVDAIDGTASFLAGEAEWGTLIALKEGDGVSLGLVSAPALRRRWWATRGSGAWSGSGSGSRAGRRLAVSTTASLAHAAVGIWPPPHRLTAPARHAAARLAAAVADVRPAVDWTTPAPPGPPPRKPSTGSGTCHGGLLVATGQVDAFLLLGAGPWDVAALVPLVEEAGGTVGDAAPRSSPSWALFSNSALHEQVLRVLDA